VVPASRCGRSPVNGPTRLTWHIVDRINYWVTLATLRVLDTVHGPEPETEADQERNHDRKQLERAFEGNELLGKKDSRR
jgi:hypothetical protein